MKLLIIRHGEPEGNERGKRFLGTYDAALSDIGLEQAYNAGKLIAERVACHDVSIVSSPLIRSMQTASAIRECLGCGPARIDPRLSEIDMGKWNGKLFDDIRDEYPEEFYARGRDLWNYKAPGGENFAETGARFKAAMESIINESPDDSILIVVSHAGAIRAGLSLMTDTPFRIWMKRSIPYAGILQVEIKDDHFCFPEKAWTYRKPGR